MGAVIAFMLGAVFIAVFLYVKGRKTLPPKQPEWNQPGNRGLEAMNIHTPTVITRPTPPSPPPRMPPPPAPVAPVFDVRIIDTRGRSIEDLPGAPRGLMLASLIYELENTDPCENVHTRQRVMELSTLCGHSIQVRAAAMVAAIQAHTPIPMPTPAPPSPPPVVPIMDPEPEDAPAPLHKHGRRLDV